MVGEWSKLVALLTRDERVKLWRVFAVMMLTGLFDLVGVTSILPFLTVVARPSSVMEFSILSWVHEWFGQPSTEQFILLLGATSLGAILLSNLLAIAALRSMLRFSFSLNEALAVRVLSNYLNQPYVYFLSQSTSDLIVNVTGEVEGVVNGVLLPGLQALSKFIAALLMALLVVAVEPVLAIVFLGLFGGLYIAIYLMVRRPVSMYGERAVEARRRSFAFSNEAFSGIKQLKLGGREGYYRTQFESCAHQYASSQIAYNTIAATPRHLIETLAFGSVVFVVVFLLKTGRDVQSAIPLLVLYALAGYRLIPVFQALFQNFATLRANWRSVELLSKESWVSQNEFKRDGGDPARLPFDVSIELQNVKFKYPGAADFTIECELLRIPKNTSVAFVGETGAGKTTLVDVVLGLLEATSGQLLVDGVEVLSTNVRGWQKNIGYVPQEIFLTDTTIAGNIAFGLPASQIDMSKVEAAARAAQLHRFVTELPQRYQTKVGERGVRLSGGQRQRIGIARALYHDPAVLVFDEATSALDSATEVAVVEAIRGLSHRKTILTIAHRISTIMDCDVIFLVENGKVADQGNYGELMERSDAFRRLTRSR